MKTVVITGGTRGFGFALAKEMKTRGCRVFVCGTSEDGVKKAVETLHKTIQNGEADGVCCDVSSREDVVDLCKAAVNRFGGIDIWINNAGVNQRYAYAWELDEAETDTLLGVDLKGTVNGTVTALEQMTKQGHGAIYNVEGMGSNDALQPKLALYGTAKRAVTYYTDAVAKELAETGSLVLIGKISPGIMITDFLTSAGGTKNACTLDEKTKKVYNILGDRPETIAEKLADTILANKKQNRRIAWLTGPKAAFRFMTAGLNKRDFFAEK